MIKGVATKDLNLIPDERGFLMEMLRSDDEIFERFGQVYMTCCYPNVVKGWHYHRKQTDFFVCVRGMAKVVLYDGREDSSTFGEINEFFIGERRQKLLKIPPLLMHGFKAVGDELAYIINCPTEPFNREEPDEYRLPWDTDEIPYDWDIKMG